jgi:hypothetical protein
MDLLMNLACMVCRYSSLADSSHGVLGMSLIYTSFSYSVLDGVPVYTPSQIRIVAASGSKFRTRVLSSTTFP